MNSSLTLATLKDSDFLNNMEISERRQKAWVGDAVLSLYARQWILREKGKMEGQTLTQMTSNDFLATIGNPTKVEAAVGIIYEREGLDSAFRWIEHEILPHFLNQTKPKGRRRNKKSAKAASSEAQQAA